MSVGVSSGGSERVSAARESRVLSAEELDVLPMISGPGPVSEEGLMELEAERRVSTMEYRERLAVLRGQRETYRRERDAARRELAEAEVLLPGEVRVPAWVFSAMILALVVHDLVLIVGRVF
jgi:hypothetical protein